MAPPELLRKTSAILDDKADELQRSSNRVHSDTLLARPVPLCASNTREPTAIDVLMSKMYEQHFQQKPATNERSNHTSSSDAESFATSNSVERSDSLVSPESVEVLRLKKQLELTNERMAQMDLEINQFRLAHHTVEHAIGSPFPSAVEPAFRPTANDRDILLKPLPAQRSQHSMLSLQTAASRSQFDVPASAGLFDHPPPRFGDSAARLPSFTPPITPLVSHDSFHGPSMYGGAALGPIGTRLSPTASEFSSWPGLPPQPHPTAYMSNTEPLNYRRLLDRDMNCDWKYIVDKIVCSNDQQASIFLQQKLKVGTTEQKFDIVQAIISSAYALMVNRFGNFLVQRCFEHGTSDQVVAIAQAIRGNTLSLSMDPFGCHVVQKAFDYVPEDYKAIMVHELLRRIPETVIHRYACHVWQKLFELRWSESPPQIMRYVNDALRGMWHEVALGETGSLVVQNIFENCLEEDKRPCITEVLANIDVIAHGQFGNWCIQHICEHGSLADRTRAVDHVLRFATEYSIDQFASKVVEKCLKIGGQDFLDHYLARVCESRPDRPRMPLVDIAGDQFGNYLIHYILSNADAQRREVVAGHIRKHMVSLRGSKYGSRVAMLCSNSVSQRAEPFSNGREPPHYRGYWTADTGRPHDRLPAGMRRPYAAYR